MWQRENLCEQGYDAVSLKGSYIAWLMAEIKKRGGRRNLRFRGKRALRKKFHKNIFSKFAKPSTSMKLR